MRIVLDVLNTTLLYPRSSKCTAMTVRVIVTCRAYVMLHMVTLRNVLLICMYCRLYKVQEAQLSPRDRAMRRVNKILL